MEFEDGPHADAGAIVGDLGTGRPDPTPPAWSVPDIPTTPPKQKPRAAPAVRKRARELGVDLAQLVSSGPDGTVTLAAVEGATGDDRLHGARHHHRAITGGDAARFLAAACADLAQSS